MQLHTRKRSKVNVWNDVNYYTGAGEWSESSPIYSATPLPSSPVAQAASTGRTRLPLSHGTFVPMTSYEQRGSRPPSQDSSTRTIAITSITFTVATFCVFMFASFVCAYKGICMLCKRCTCVRCRSEAGASSTTTRSSLIAPGTVNMYNIIQTPLHSKLCIHNYIYLSLVHRI